MGSNGDMSRKRKGNRQGEGEGEEWQKRYTCGVKTSPRSIPYRERRKERERKRERMDMNEIVRRDRVSSCDWGSSASVGVPATAAATATASSSSATTVVPVESRGSRRLHDGSGRLRRSSRRGLGSRRPGLMSAGLLALALLLVVSLLRLSIDRGWTTGIRFRLEHRGGIDDR